MNIAKDWLP